MPLRPPALDDRSFDDLVEEVLARIPAHTPEWTNPRLGDPGRTLIDLFAWLTDTLLYRANLIPERQRLAFLRLLGVPLRPAIPAHGLITLSFSEQTRAQPQTLRPLASIKKPAPFETTTEITIQPIVAEAFYKRRLRADEELTFAPLLPGLQQIYGLANQPTPYVTTSIFIDGMPEPEGFDLVQQSIDRSLWFALLTLKEDPDDTFKDTLRAALGDGHQSLSVGVSPQVVVPPLYVEVGQSARIPYTWEISYLADQQRNLVDYISLGLVPGTDTTAGLTRQGVMKLQLPSKDFIGAPSNNVRIALTAGVGNLPPRLDDPKKASRLVAWLRLRPTQFMESLALSWVGVNAVEIDGRQTTTGRMVGESNGAPDQEMQLPGQSVDATTLQIEVAEPDQKYQLWQRIDDLALASREQLVYSLDSEAGMIRFGDGVRGRIPLPRARVRVASMRAGGGQAGNLPAGILTEISALDLGGNPAARLTIRQPLPTIGGEDAESLEQAERRIPDLFRHRDRAVTADDYRRLALTTPGTRVGRVDVLPRFKPHQRRGEVPGVVSVMVLPARTGMNAPNPRADRPFLETVYAYLDSRRPLTTELYAIGCEYIAIGLSTGMTVRDGFGREAVIQAVRDALNLFLWPLVPGGTNGAGWDLGRAVNDRELEVVVARVPGVLSVTGVNLFTRRNRLWLRASPSASGATEITLERWQLPELLAVVVDADGSLPDNLSRAPLPFVEEAVGVPIVPEVC